MNLSTMRVSRALILLAGLDLASQRISAFCPITPRSGSIGSTVHSSVRPNSDVGPNFFVARRSSVDQVRFKLSPDSNHESSSINRMVNKVKANPSQSVSFSVLMTVCGALLGPFLDSYHSAFGVLQYKEPIGAALWGSAQYPALTTTWWVPELFGLAGFIIGWLYILLDAAIVSEANVDAKTPSPPRILVAISLFTLQYWLSGVLYQGGVDRVTILNIMSVSAAFGFLTLDSTLAGFLTSAATAFCGPLIEAGLLTLSKSGILTSGYRYTDLGETGFFPLWIVPVYFLGGPAVGLLARGFWNALGAQQRHVAQKAKSPPGCKECGDTRRVPCPNCDGVGTYVATGGRVVQCTSCRGRGFVICRSCFSYYDEDPNDIEAIRDLLSRMPD
eukprot:scaffold2095_cov166-Amphora_coffeaeformis.AAC.3